MTTGWQKSFELHDGEPTGRWQWVIETRYCGEYFFPGYWLQPEAISVPPDISPDHGVCEQ